MKFADTKLESSEPYLIKYGKKLSSGFRIMDIFCRNEVSKVCSYFKRFYSDCKINNIFFQIRTDIFLFRCQKSNKS